MSTDNEIGLFRNYSFRQLQWSRYSANDEGGAVYRADEWMVDQAVP